METAKPGKTSQMWRQGVTPSWGEEVALHVSGRDATSLINLYAGGDRIIIIIIIVIFFPYKYSKRKVEQSKYLQL